MADAIRTITLNRRALAAPAVVLGLACGPVLAGRGSVPTLSADAALFALVEELRQAETAVEHACDRHTAAETIGDEAADAAAETDMDAAFEARDAVLAQLAATPAVTLEGLLAKAMRIAWQIRDESGHSLIAAEYPLAASVFADGLRLLPAGDPRPAYMAGRATG
jgi:hypothetical protein